MSENNENNEFILTDLAYENNIGISSSKYV